MFDFSDFLDLFDTGQDDANAMQGSNGLGNLPSQMGAEGVLADTDGDGIADSMVFQKLQDIDGDGIPDMLVTEQRIDTDGDGIFDAIRLDNSLDVNGDGYADVHSVILGLDTNGDGIVDYMQTADDFNNDGIFDNVQESFGLNGLNLAGDGGIPAAPMVHEDSNPTVSGDPGILPSQSGAEGVLVDTDGDGIADAMVFQQFRDTDGDGEVDTLVTEQRIDVDGDGVFDALQVDILEDVDGDGFVDAHSVITGLDTDGDGIVDYVETAKDFNNDGVFDSVEVLPGSDSASPVEDGGFMVGDAPAYENFDPRSADPAHIVGDPAEAMESWHHQETSNSCAVASQEFVLEQLTGREFDESVLRNLAEEQGWYSPRGGTPMEDVGNILEYMGLTVERSHGNSIRDLERCLERGGEVIVGVDSSEIWEGQDDDFFGPGMDADHAVQVIGIDYSSPGNPMVILNDPGAANGGGAMISMDVFMAAWEDSGCHMVAAYA